jgi:hypothetical protein
MTKTTARLRRIRENIESFGLCVCGERKRNIPQKDGLKRAFCFNTLSIA